MYICMYICSYIMDKNLQTLLKICSVFGIYLKTSSSGSRNGSRIFRIYIMLLMGILILNCVLGIMNNAISNEFIISWVVSTAVFISQMFTHLIILYEALTRHREHTDFLRILQHVDVCFKILLKMNIKTPTIIKEIRSKLILMTVISKICLLVFAVNFLLYSDDGYFWWALLAIFAMRFRCFQVIMYVEILKYYILALNKKLHQIVCLKMEKSKQLLDIDYKHLHSIEVIENMKHIYASLYEASTLMNEFCQASMFAASASSFLDFTCHLYWILLVMDDLILPINIVSSMVTILPLGWFIFKYCFICQIIKNEVERTSLLLSRLVSCDVCPLVKRNYKKNLVHDFCMQIMHQRIEFTGNRFFTFDLKCIFAICALIATHLIILVQFSKSDTSNQILLNKTAVKET